MSDPTSIGRYKIINRLGHGGMGALFLAHDPAIDRMVAIKVMREGMDNPELRARFGREARAAGRLRHPNVVTIFDVGEEQGQPFIAMEYVAGQTLEAMIQRRSHLSLVRKLKILEELCDGLAYAHKAGVVHRDIKPANLMLDSEGMLKILDFGIVRFAQSGMTQSGMLVGTLAYMSPEQVSGKPVDYRSDIFAVGDVAYELLSGKQAFPGNLQDGIMHRILHDAPKPLEQLCTGLDPEISRIVSRALEKEPSDRYPDLVKMRRDLARVRERLEEEEETGENSSSAETIATGPKRQPKPDSAGGTTPRPATDTGDSRAASRREVEQRRQARIRQGLEAAERALEAGDFEVAIAAADDVAMLDPNNERAVEIVERARMAVEDKQVNGWLDEARDHLNRGDATQAAALVEQARGLRPSSSEVKGVQQAVDDVRHELELARERAQIVREAVTRARADLAGGAFEMAIRAAAEALARQPQHTEALEITQQASAALEEQRKREQHERAAAQAIEQARRAFETGRHDEAIQTLEHFQPPHADVSSVLQDFQRQALEIKRRREEEEREALRRKIAALTAAAQQASDAGRYDDAIGLLERVRELDPASLAATTLLRKVLDLRSAAEAAARLRAEIEQKLREGAAALERDDIGDALRFQAEALQLDPQDAAATSFHRVIEEKAEALLSTARQASDNGRYEQAVDVATRVRALQSHAPAAESLIHEARQRQAAAEAAARTRALVSEKVSAATAALEQDDLRTAALRHSEARTLDEADGEVVQLGQILQRRCEVLLADARVAIDSDRFDDALQLLERVRELDPRSGAAEVLQRTIIERREAEEAAARTRSLIEQHVAQASAALARGELALAARLQEEASRLDPAHSAVSALGAELTRRRSAVETHIRAAREAIQKREFKAALDEVGRARAIDVESKQLAALAEQAASGLAELEREARRRKQFETALAAAAERLERGALDEALALANTALTLDQASADARALGRRVQQAIDARAEAERLASERRARDARVAKVIEKARKARTHDQAIRLLREALEIDTAHEALLALLAERERAQEADRVRIEEERLAAQRRAQEARIAKALDKARRSRSHDAAMRVLRDALATDPDSAQLLNAIREREAEREAEGLSRATSTASVPDASTGASPIRDVEHTALPAITSRGKWLIAVGGLAALLALAAGVWNMRTRDVPGQDQTTASVPNSGATGQGADSPRARAETGEPPSRPSSPDSTRPPSSSAASAAATTPPAVTATPEPVAPLPETKDAVAALERQLAPLRQRARQELARGQLQQALATAQNGLKLKSDDQALRAVLTGVVSRASDETSRARRDAEQSGAPTSAAATYQRALDLERAARTERSAGRHDAAARGLWNARDAFARAAGEVKQFAAAEAERQQQAAAARRASESAPPVRTDPEPRPSSPTNPPAAPPTTTGAPAPAPGSAPRVDPPPVTAPAKPAETVSLPRSSPVDDRAGIEQTIRAYELAYSSEDINAIRRVQTLSTAEANTLQNTFREARAYKVTVQIQGITIAPGGGQATVTCSRRIEFRSSLGDQDRTVPTVFTLQKRGTGWVIVSVAAR